VKIVLGLGNPGPHYASTRHNIGFRVVDCLAERAGVRPARAGGASELTWSAATEFGGEPVVLAKPRTFMNRSGRAAVDLVRRLDAAPGDLLVVHDDADLALGRIRIRSGGGTGGHNGIRSITDALQTPEFLRLKLGVRGAARDATDLSDYVLEPFADDETQAVAMLVTLGADAVETILCAGLEAAMNRFHPSG
jgi:PTH1 family peptidyl-tRNA hydrolase